MNSKSLLLFTLAAAASPSLALKVPFDTPTGSAEDVKTVYGVDVFKNEMSTVRLSVDTGSVLQADVIFASDTFHRANDAGTIVRPGYTANVGILIPLTPAWATRDLSAMDSITLDYSLSIGPSGGLAFSLGSLSYVDSVSNLGYAYENFQKKAAAVAGALNTWRSYSISRASLGLPSWVSDALTYYPSRWLPLQAQTPTLDSVLKQVRSLQVSPRTNYYADKIPGWSFSTNKACTDCITPNTVGTISIRLRNINVWLHGVEAPLRLGMSNGLEIGVRDLARKGAWAGVRWSNGELSLANPGLWKTVQILSADGRTLQQLAPVSSQGLDLPNGTYFAKLTDLQGQSAAQVFQIIR